MSLAFLNQIGFQELVVILVIVLLLFGKRFPEVMRSIGRGIVELKKGMRDVESEINKPVDEKPASPTKPADGAEVAQTSDRDSARQTPAG